MSEPIPYDPNCLHCRRDAGKDSAGVTRLCEAHKDAQLAAFQHDLAEAREKLAEREGVVGGVYRYTLKGRREPVQQSLLGGAA